MNRVPGRFQRVLWSYDIRSIDLRRDKQLIIQQVLNYGNWEDLRWLYRNYSKEEIREVVQNPRRGVWFDEVLDFWCLMLNVHLPKRVKERAIFRVEPRFDLWPQLIPSR